jgi:hypothetical protein
MGTDREQLTADIERELQQHFGNAPLIGSLRGQPWTPTTRTIKEFLCKLGHDRGFRVAARECAGTDWSEWLYDMVWYEQDKELYLTRQILVMECELAPEPPVDGDFQKLIQARADVRIWISCSPNEKIAEEQLANCKRQAALFSGAMAGDSYIFITDNWTNPKTSIERFIVGHDGAPEARRVD